MLAKQMGKLIRAMIQGKRIKLQLSALLSKGSLDFVLSGLKGNSVVEELNVSQNQLDDDELRSLCIRLSDD